MLHALWDLMKMGPTSANQLPARIVWCVSQEAKDKLAALASGNNAPKIQAAPVAAILAMDENFHDYLPELYPALDARSWFANDEPLRRESAFRNSSLQGGYFILAARALGLGVGPMSGFDKAAVDAAFFPAQPSYKRSEEHTSELQSLMRNSYDVFGLQKKNVSVTYDYIQHHTNTI